VQSIGHASTKPDKAAHELKKTLTKQLTLPSENAELLDQRLAMLMSVQTRYSTPPPALHLGTIVVERKSGESRYLLCMQPVCDSVRLSGVRAFPFLPLTTVGDDRDCDFIIPDKEKNVRLALSNRPFEVKMINFAPAGRDREIMARMAKTGRFFKASNAGGATYRWVVDLKPDHAQRVANDYAHKISRVGLTESE
jgi:hypothetical protein